MEKVFWLMWLADVVGSVGIVAVIACVAAGACFTVLGIQAAMDEEVSFSRAVIALRWLALPVVLGVIIPSANTIRVLAVAEAAHVATDTQIGKKGVEALDAVLDKVIAVSKAK